MKQMQRSLTPGTFGRVSPGANSAIVVMPSYEGATVRSDTTMHGARMKHESSADHSDVATRQKMITVIALEDGFAGALAYALQSALHEPAMIRVVRVGQPGERDRDHRIPLPISTITAESADAVVRRSARHDVIVMEASGQLDESADSLLFDIRRNASCLVVEVDDDGKVVRASGPEGWSYAAPGNAATTISVDSGGQR
jgi:hypothetical protein